MRIEDDHMLLMICTRILVFFSPGRKDFSSRNSIIFVRMTTASFGTLVSFHLTSKMTKVGFSSWWSALSEFIFSFRSIRSVIPSESFIIKELLLPLESVYNVNVGYILKLYKRKFTELEVVNVICLKSKTKLTNKHVQKGDWLHKNPKPTVSITQIRLHTA